MPHIQRITPCLWFDTAAAEAAAHYVSIFDNSRIVTTSHYGEGAPKPKGSVMVVEFELDRQRFRALNGGPMFQFSEAISLSVACETQDEVDHYWAALGRGGRNSRCGWLKDRFGLSWQVVPTALATLLGSGDALRSARVMAALMRMDKIDIAALRDAFDGR